MHAGMKEQPNSVLILVVMEDALWREIHLRINQKVMVLILVVMEDALWLWSIELHTEDGFLS